MIGEAMDAAAKEASKVSSLLGGAGQPPANPLPKTIVSVTTDLLTVLPLPLHHFFKVTDITVVGDIYGCDAAEDPDLKVGLPYVKVTINKVNPAISFDDLSFGLFQVFSCFAFISDKNEAIKSSPEEAFNATHETISLGSYAIVGMKESSKKTADSIEIIGIHPWYIYQNVESRAYSDQNSATAIVKDVLKNTKAMAGVNSGGDFLQKLNSMLTLCDGPELPYYRNSEQDLPFIQRVIESTTIKDSPTIFFVNIKGDTKLTSYSKLASGKASGALFSPPKSMPSSIVVNGTVIPMSDQGSTYQMNTLVAKKHFGYIPEESDKVFFGISEESEVEVGKNWRSTIVKYISDISNLGDSAIAMTLSPAITATDSHQDDSILPMNKMGYTFATATKSLVEHHLHNEEAAYKGIASLRMAESLITVNIKIPGTLSDHFNVLPDVGELVFYGAGSFVSGLNGQYVCARSTLHFHLGDEVANSKENFSRVAPAYISTVEGEFELVRPFLDEWYREQFDVGDPSEEKVPSGYSKSSYEAART